MTEFRGTLALTRLAVHRDRVLIPATVAAFVATVAASAPATVHLYPTAASRIAAATAVNDLPALTALYGRIWDPSSLGALVIFKLAVFGAAMVAATAIILVVRHTRAEEENGRLELVGATVVGRRAALSAAVLTTSVTMLVVGVVTALSAILAGLPATGSWLLGMSWTASGVAFTGVAAVTAQLTVTARAAVGSGLAVLGAAYLLRAAGDTSAGPAEPGLWSWLSPIGWSQQVRPYAGDRWWLLGPSLLCGALMVVAAFALAARRDLGAGLLPERPGVAVASPELSSPWGLAWRLHRGTLAAWAVAYIALGLVFGTISSGVAGFFGSAQAQDLIRRLGGTQSLTEAFLATEFAFIAVFTAAYGIATVARLRAEETGGHAELLLAAAVPRSRWILSHVAVALIGTTLLTVLAGVSAGVATSSSAGASSGLVPILGGTVVYLPAVWVMTTLSMAVFAAAPRLTGLAWVALVLVFLLGEIGPLLELPSWAMGISPFTHIPRLPGADMRWGPPSVVLMLAAAVLAVGAVAFRRRDLEHR